MPEAIQTWWLQGGFAAFCLFLCWLLNTTMKQVLEQLTQIAVHVKSLVDQQDAGMKFVVERLIASIQDEETKK